MTISSTWQTVNYVNRYDYITAAENSDQMDALQSRDLFLLNKFSQYYTQNEIDNLFSTYTTNLDWKESVETYDEIAINYPEPEDGWVVNTKDTNYTYRYDAEEDKWIAISANAIPLATEEIDGLLSKEDYAYIRQIESDILPLIYTRMNQMEERALPLGTIVPYSFNSMTPPPGFVFAEGGVYLREDYPDMWAKLEATREYVEDDSREAFPGRFTNGDGSTTFRVPDLRGLFLRGLDNNRHYESSSRGFGTFQNDAIGEHSHEVMVTGVGSIDDDAIENDKLVLVGTTQNEYSKHAVVNYYTSEEAETRPKNVAVRFIVKILPTEKIPVTIDTTDMPELERPVDADTLQGHAPSISPIAYTIPVADANGKLDNDWFNVEAILDDNFVRHDEVSTYPDSNKIPVSNDAEVLDDWISVVTIEDVDKWINYLGNINYPLSSLLGNTESFEDVEDNKKKFISKKKFIKFLVGLREFIRTFKQHYTTEDIEPTNERGYISNAERIKYSDKYTKNETYQLLYNFLQSYIPLTDASVFSAANKIPIANEEGKLDRSWLPNIFLNKIGTDENTGYAEVTEDNEIVIKSGITDNTLTNDVIIQGGGVFSYEDISPAKEIISGYDLVTNTGGNIQLIAGTGGNSASSIGGSIILTSGTGNNYDGNIVLNDININKYNIIYTNNSSIKLQQNESSNNIQTSSNSFELTNSGISYIHDNLLNDSDDFNFILNNDGSVNTNKPNVPNGITLLNSRAIVPFENLPKTVIINNIGDFVSNQSINTNLGNVIVGNIGQNTTLTIEDQPYSNEAKELTFVLTIKGLYNVNWPINVTWLSGAKPELGYGETAIIKLFRIESGEWLGWKVGDAVNFEEISQEISIDENEAPLNDFTGTIHKYVVNTDYIVDPNIEIYEVNIPINLKEQNSEIENGLAKVLIGGRVYFVTITEGTGTLNVELEEGTYSMRIDYYDNIDYEDFMANPPNVPDYSTIITDITVPE